MRIGQRCRNQSNCTFYGCWFVHDSGTRREERERGRSVNARDKVCVPVVNRASPPQNAVLNIGKAAGDLLGAVPSPRNMSTCKTAPPVQKGPQSPSRKQGCDGVGMSYACVAGSGHDTNNDELELTIIATSIKAEHKPGVIMKSMDKISGMQIMMDRPGGKCFRGLVESVTEDGHLNVIFSLKDKIRFQIHTSCVDRYVIYDESLLD